MGLTRLEQETVITFNEDEEVATFYTASPVMYRRMIKRGFVAEKLGEDSWRFEMPRKCLKLPQKPRVRSEREKLSSLESAKRLRLVRVAKKSSHA